MRLINIFLLVLIFSLTLFAQSTDLPKDWSSAQKDVWKAVNARWQAWTDDDLEKYLAFHHQDWHRFALPTDDLEDKNGLQEFWKRAKQSEKTLSFTLDPVEVKIYGKGQFAAVHYTVDEKIKTLKERITADGRKIPVGNEKVIPIRFSDFLVLEDGRWLYIGGYRDGSCSLFQGFGK